jgi:hypothetical protein
MVACDGTLKPGLPARSEASSFFGPHVGCFALSATTTFSTSGGVRAFCVFGAREKSNRPRGPSSTYRARIL